MTWAMYDQLDEALSWLEADPTIRVVELRGAGGHFVAGTDIGQFASFSSGDDGVAYERRLEAIVSRLENVRVPTVAVVQGNAAGAGLLFAAACDIRVCTPDAMFLGADRAHGRQHACRWRALRDWSPTSVRRERRRSS